ncbi:MAG: ribosome silencing factor [Candidatus Cloacimonetes bacterium]|nr:ribosome silencing factor [Candidatus Cloacimonadota bacterium]
MKLKFNELKNLIIKSAYDKKAEDIQFFDVKEKSDYTDGVIICHGTGDLHVKAIAENIIAMAKENKIQVISKEGMQNLTWVLIDFVDIVVHVFNEETRKYYKLEKLWNVSAKNKENIEKENVEKKDT